jgi:ubiquinone/menaquinone biosynthesis C-methylase UbiE
MKDLKVNNSMVQDSYNSEKAVDEYTLNTKEIGLWKSEEIIINKYFKHKDKILDIGCGAGRTTLELHRLGYKNIEGLDLSEKMILKCNELRDSMNYEIKFHVGDATKLQFENRSFDGALFSFNGIMQIPQQENRIQALKEIRRVLKSNGYFIFTTHDRYDKEGTFRSLWKEEEEKWSENKQDNRLYEFGDMIITIGDKESFIHFPTRDEVLDTIEKSGLILVEDMLRSEICDEYERVKNHSSDCRFYIVKI